MEEQFQPFATQQAQEIYQKIAIHLPYLFERKQQAPITVNHSRAEQRSMHLRPEYPSIFQPIPCGVT